MAGSSDNIIRFPGEPVAEVEAAAAAWMARVTSGSLSLGELAEFEFWRAASPDHDRIYREMETMWDGLGAAAGSTPNTPYRRVIAGLRRPDRFSGWAVRLGQIAAGLVAVVMASQYMSTWRYEYHTEPGEIREVTLADGSVVHMKGGTALEADVSETGARTIELARGEAFFEVVHDASRPFTVTAGSGAIHDIGTGFSVERDGRSTHVAVEHGVVAVVAGGRSDILTPGQQVSFNPYDMGRKQAVDPSVISAWRRGLYVAEGKPLGDVLAQIDEYHSGRIVVTSRALAARRVNAVVQFDHVDAWLDALNETRGVSVRRWGPLVIVGDRRP
ncbi:FecR family protein [Brevundimonas sp.]|uniref:FecR family protein n=1 Tax=Brevundimonas sp. TaxID=1871086 RepID=UPI003D0BFCE6